MISCAPSDPQSDKGARGSDVAGHPRVCGDGGGEHHDQGVEDGGAVWPSSRTSVST